MNKGLQAIYDEIYVPCYQNSEHPCPACVQIGLEKAYNFGFKQGEKTADIKVEALQSLKSKE